MNTANPSFDDPCVLGEFLDASPVAWHAADNAVAVLRAAGFTESHLDMPIDVVTGRHFVRVQGSVIAWQVRQGAGPAVPFRIAAAHTDSPGFRIKPNPQTTVAGCVRLGVEVYGGPLLNSWLDRDLGIAGTVLVADDGAMEVRPVIDHGAVLRIPQLAIHLDRAINESGLKLDRQVHMQPIWGLDSDGPTFTEYIAELARVSPAMIRGWDLAPFDVAPARTCGRSGELFASARLDDLLSCHAALRALTVAEPSDEFVAIVAFVDHEEVGSTSSTGAHSAFIGRVLERISLGLGGDRASQLRALASSHALSLDMAHATHPNHPERHDSTHPVLMNAGPVVKHNAQQRYATSLTSAAPFLAACDGAGIDVQHFVSHSEMPCGSTIGPALAAGLGLPVVDVGIAQLAMHSTREVCGSSDHGRLARALKHYLSHL